MGHLPEVAVHAPSVPTLANPPAMVVPQPTPVQAIPVSPAPINTAPSASRKLKAGMLEAIAQGGGAQSQEAVQYEPITQNALTAYYTQFIDNLKTNEKETVYVYLNQTTIDLRDNGDVAIVAPSFFHESYVNSEKNNLNDFFKLKFGKYLNIKAEVHKPKEDNIASVSEIYKAMVAENPHLELLKNTLGLQIIG